MVTAGTGAPGGLQEANHHCTMDFGGVKRGVPGGLQEANHHCSLLDVRFCQKPVRFALDVLVFSPEEGAKTSFLGVFLDVFTICMVEKDVQKLREKLSFGHLFGSFYNLYGRKERAKTARKAFTICMVEKDVQKLRETLTFGYIFGRFYHVYC